MSGVAEFSGSRRVPQLAALALIAFGVAGCSADMRRASSKAPSPIPSATRAKPPARCRRPRRAAGRAARAAAIFAAALAVQSSALPPPAVAAPQTIRLPRAAACPEAGAGLPPMRRRPSRSWRPPARVPPRSVAAAHPQARHDHHRRHQRYAGGAGAALSRHAGRDPRRQRLQGSAHAVAGPAADHSASRTRPRLPSQPLPATRPVASRCRRACMSSITARRSPASRIATTSRSASLPGPTISMPTRR